MKSLIFEGAVEASAERVGVRLYKVASGFVAERFLIQEDQTVLVQVLPMSARADFDGFASADPYFTEMRSIYGEVGNLVWGCESGKIR